MSDSNYAACLCGKKRLKLNETNWKRHLTFCKVAKLKKNNTVVDVHNFFTKKRKINNEDVPEKGKYNFIDAHTIAFKIFVIIIKIINSSYKKKQNFSFREKNRYLI